MVALDETSLFDDEPVILYNEHKIDDLRGHVHERLYDYR